MFSKSSSANPIRFICKFNLPNLDFSIKINMKGYPWRSQGLLGGPNEEVNEEKLRINEKKNEIKFLSWPPRFESLATRLKVIWYFFFQCKARCTELDRICHGDLSLNWTWNWRNHMNYCTCRMTKRVIELVRHGFVAVATLLFIGKIVIT